MQAQCETQNDNAWWHDGRYHLRGEDQGGHARAGSARARRSRPRRSSAAAAFLTTARATFPARASRCRRPRRRARPRAAPRHARQPTAWPLGGADRSSGARGGHRLPVLRSTASSGARGRRRAASRRFWRLARSAFLSADLVDGTSAERSDGRGLRPGGQAAGAAHAARLRQSALRGDGELPAQHPVSARRVPRRRSAAFSIAVQAADVVVDALQRDAGGMSEIEDRLVQRLEQAAAPVERDRRRRWPRATGYAFVGIDLSPAPFPTDDVSIGGAHRARGVDRFGAPGHAVRRGDDHPRDPSHASPAHAASRA